MTTKARLGIDIVATDRTRAAFSSANSAMQRFASSFAKINGLIAGISVGALARRAISSFIEINRHVAPVEQSFTLLSRAWQSFALEVGNSGLNQALIDFNTRMGQMLVGTDGLSRSIGGFLGGAIRGMQGILEGIGRAMAFTYDNFEILKRGLYAFAAATIASRILTMGFAFVKFISALKAASFATAAFTLIQRRSLLIATALIAITAHLTGTYDELVAKLNEVFTAAEGLLPGLESKTVEAIKRMGLDVSALTTDFGQFDAQLKNLPLTFAEIEDAAKKGAPALEKFKAGLAAEQVQQMASTLQSSFSSAFDSLIDGTASVAESFQKMTTDILSSLTKMFVNQAFTQFFAGFGSQSPSQSGFFSNLANGLATSFGGGRAAGGPVSPGKFYKVGERGPELFAPGRSGMIIPSRESGGVNLKVEVFNQTGSQVETRQDSKGNLRLWIRDAIRDELPGALKPIMAAQYGQTPRNQRR